MMQIEINFYVIIFKISIICLNIKCHKENITAINYLTDSINFLLFLMIFDLHSNMLLMHEFTLNKI